MKVIGEATLDDWKVQCALTGEDWLYPGEHRHVAWLKVVAE